jgi:hypothetical protein
LPETSKLVCSEKNLFLRIIPSKSHFGKRLNEQHEFYCLNPREWKPSDMQDFLENPGYSLIPGNSAEGNQVFQLPEKLITCRYWASPTATNTTRISFVSRAAVV